MEKKYQDILQELYQLDPDLRQYDNQLQQVIKTMLLKKPDTKFDKKFAQALRKELVAKAKELKGYQKNSNIWSNLKIWQTISMVSVTAVIVLLISLPLIQNNTQFISPKATVNLFSPNPSFEKLSTNAFGSLAMAVPQDNKTQSVANGLGGGGGFATSTPETTKASSRIMPPNIAYKYVFNYEGELLQTELESAEVIKRLKENKQTFDEIFQKLNLGLIDSSKFKNLKIQYLNLYEDKSGGYLLDINPNEGIITMSIDWRNWHTQENPEAIQINQIPADQNLIAIADKFLTEYGINKSNYGQPFVNEQWKVYYEQNKEAAVIPDTLSVIYPLIINNKNVYEEFGMQVGLNVNINIRDMKVMSMNNLFTTNYQISEYPTETDFQKIINIAEKGGLYGAPDYVADNDSTEVKETKITLGTPTLEYMRYWKHDNNKSEELFVPAYIFPILKSEGEQTFFKQKIVVPIIKEILENVSSSSSTITPLPEPLPVEILREEEKMTTDDSSSEYLTYEEAKTIAINSDCVKDGALKEEHFFNENSKTWWFDLDIEKPGCKPACVVDEKTKTAEINWRCTGLISE